MATPKPQQRGNIIDPKDLRTLARIVSRNWYIVVVALAMSAVLAFLYVYKLSDIYGASTQILLKDKDSYDYQSSVYKSLGYAGIYGDLVNQKRVLTSHDLVNATLDKLDFDMSTFIVGRLKTTQVHGTLPFTVEIDLLAPRLYEKPFDLRIMSVDSFELSYEKEEGIVQRRFAFAQPAHDEEFRMTVSLSPYVNASTIDKHRESDYRFIQHERKTVVGQFKNRINVENHDYTTILQITVEDEVPIRAKMFLDTLSKVYIDYTLQSEFDINTNTINYIDRQLEDVTAILEEHEDELQEYREQKDILNLSKEEGLYFNELVRFDQQRRRLEMDIQSLDALEDYLQTSTDEKLLPPAVFITDDEFLRQTLSELYGLQMTRNRMLFSGTPDNRTVQELDQTLLQNRGNLLVYIGNSRKALEGRIADVQAQINDYERLIRKLPKSQRDVLNIERRRNVNEKMYLFLLEKRASTVIARAGIVPQTKVIEKARSIGVVRPDKPRIYYTFLLGGAVIAMLVVFIRVMFYDRIENMEQLKELTELPVFGEIIASEKAEENYVVVDADPKAAITESFRTVRTNLEYLPGRADAGRVVLLTSYRPNEGKTFCSVNLAAILAKAGKKVLLLEMDLHKPKVAVGLGMNNPIGLSNILIGRVAWREAVLPTRFENFSVLLSGPTPPNASELVLSPHLVELLTEARSDYDYILIDTPPVGLITDALLMMRHADATLFVLNTRFADKDHVTNAIESLKGAGGQNIGLILNGVRMKKSKYYYNTNYGYGYRYAYGYGGRYGYGYGGRKKGSEGSGQADTKA